MLLTLLFLIFGLYALISGQLPLVGKYKLKGATARIVGGLLILIALIIPVLGGISR